MENLTSILLVKELSLPYNASMESELEIIRLNGNAARAFVNELAELRLKVFWDFPYLYEGTVEYEKKYLETYFTAKKSFILLIKDGPQVVGATTGILASEEEESFRKPFELAGFDPATVFYFGESVLLPHYRGRGLGKIFFQEREAFARSLGTIRTLSFCAVVRDSHHPLMPPDYRPLNTFWESQGFEMHPSMTTTYEWLDRGENAVSAKKMQYWIKNI